MEGSAERDLDDPLATHVGRVDGEDGGGVSEDGGLEFTTEVVSLREKERESERIGAACKDGRMVRMLPDLCNGRDPGRDPTEGETAASAVGGGDRGGREGGGTLKEFN